MDLQAAEGGGAQGVGVTTGIFTRAELAAAGPGAHPLVRVTLICTTKNTNLTEDPLSNLPLEECRRVRRGSLRALRAHTWQVLSFF